jgi:hypothetical protein
MIPAIEGLHRGWQVGLDIDGCFSGLINLMV